MPQNLLVVQTFWRCLCVYSNLRPRPVHLAFLPSLEVWSWPLTVWSLWVGASGNSGDFLLSLVMSRVSCWIFNDYGGGSIQVDSSKELPEGICTCSFCWWASWEAEGTKCDVCITQPKKTVSWQNKLGHYSGQCFVHCSGVALSVGLLSGLFHSLAWFDRNVASA